MFTFYKECSAIINIAFFLRPHKILSYRNSLKFHVVYSLYKTMLPVIAHFVTTSRTCLLTFMLPIDIPSAFHRDMSSTRLDLSNQLVFFFSLFHGVACPLSKLPCLWTVSPFLGIVLPLQLEWLNVFNWGCYWNSNLWIFQSLLGL